MCNRLRAGPTPHQATPNGPWARTRPNSAFRQVKRALRGKGPDPRGRSARVPGSQPGIQAADLPVLPPKARSRGVSVAGGSALIQRAAVQVLMHVCLPVSGIVVRVPSRWSVIRRCCRAAYPGQPGRHVPLAPAGGPGRADEGGSFHFPVRACIRAVQRRLGQAAHGRFEGSATQTLTRQLRALDFACLGPP
jgi:hypothetical protein